MIIKTRHTGLTIIEILVAVAIVAILAAGMYSVSNYLQKQAQIKLAESTIDALCTAIEQYRQFNGNFPFQAGTNFSRTNLQTALSGDVADKSCAVVPAINYDPCYASIEVLCYFLNQVPESRQIVNSINSSLLTNKGVKGTEYTFKPNGDTQCYELKHVLDPWQMPLRYTYAAGDNFPVIESAGPDKDFGDNVPALARDNISSR